MIDTLKPSSFVGFIPVVFSNTATDYEAMVYLHTASLATPFSESWYNIYMYLLSKYYPQQAKRIGVYREKLTEVEKRKLEELKKWIYRQQMNKRK